MINLLYNTTLLNNKYYQQSSWFDTLVEWLMAALLLFMPLAFGVVHAWSELMVIVLVGTMVLCVILKHIVVVRWSGLRRSYDDSSEMHPKWVWSWVYIPMLIFIMIICLQLVPLPSGFVKMVSPNTWELKQTLLSGVAGNSASDWMTLTFYSQATRHDLLMVLVVVMVFFVVVNVYRTAPQIKRLLLVISFVGAIVALLAMAQGLFGNGKIFWHVVTGETILRSGPFVNHGHFGQYINLSIGAALALLLVKLYEAVCHEKNEQQVAKPAADVNRADQRSFMSCKVIKRLTKPTMHLIWGLSVMIVLSLVTLCLSLTRGGMVSMLVAGVFTTIMMVRNRRYSFEVLAMVLLAMVAFVCILYTGFDAVYDRLVTLGELKNYDSRLGLVNSLTPVIRKFGIFGIGLGAHAMVYPMWDLTNTGKFVGHAENEYVQVFAETGLVGLLMVVLVVIITWRHYFRCVGHERLPICMAALGLGYGLLAVMVHSACDFGLHLPAISCLVAIFCGLLNNLRRLMYRDAISSRTQVDHHSRQMSPKGGFWLNNSGQFSGLPVRLVLPAFLLGFVGLWGWMLFEAESACAAQKHWDQAVQVEKRVKKNKWQGSDGDYHLMVSHAAQALGHQPGNVEYLYWLNVYRWLDLDRKNLDKSDSQYQEKVAGLIDNFHRGRLICPVYGKLYFMAGQLEYHVIGKQGNVSASKEGVTNVQVAFKLGGGHPTISWGAALMDIQQGHLKESTQKFRRYVSSGGKFDDVIKVYIGQFDRSDLAMEVAGDDPMLLDRLATSLARLEGYEDLVKNTRSQAIEILKPQVAGTNATSKNLANLGYIYYNDGDYDNAIGTFRRTLDISPERVDCRLMLAKSLDLTGEVSQAKKQARWCMRMRPKWKSARKLLKRLEGRS